ncbi:MAG: hypothetical protein IKD93_00655, partial [Firmicutes bacterium]|nr:hypothetical protein [Bacillota bacterium]
LAETARRLATDYAAGFRERDLTMLVEEEAVLSGRSYLRGHSGNYLTLLLPADEADRPVRRVRIVDAMSEGLLVRECGGEGSEY